MFFGTLGLIQLDVMADTMVVERSKFEPDENKGIALMPSFYMVFFFFLFFLIFFQLHNSLLQHPPCLIVVLILILMLIIELILFLCYVMSCQDKCRHLATPFASVVVSSELL